MPQGRVLTALLCATDLCRYTSRDRSALEWVIDQYQVSEDKRSGIRSDPNRPDDPEYIFRLFCQVVRFSVQTVRIVAALPECYSGSRDSLTP